ncbi:hypothetical protein GCM10027345_42150 [Hymenobacter daeguensis]
MASTSIVTHPTTDTDAAAAAAAAQPTQTLAQLQARAVALELPAGPVRAQLQPTATVPTKPAATPLPRWSVQVLAGPALTYRQLGSAVPAYPLTPVTTSPGQYQYAQSTIVELERPALAPSGQIQFRRTLNGRWALAGGLGYRQYASALAIRLYQTTNPNYLLANGVSLLNDSAQASTIHRRDTYNYLTVPVQASYALGIGHGRWRTALLAGAELGVYLGGTTSEGTACACTTRTWYPTGSPYRALSLALSLGLDVRYRLGPAASLWELLAQPQATYGFTSLTRAGSGFDARYPFGGGLLLGVSRGLR